MKSIMRKTVSVSAAMALSVVSVHSVTAEETADIKGNINKPYLNINVTSEEKPENLEYKLINSDGKTVASWIDEDFINADISGVKNITGLTDISVLDTDKFPIGDSYLYGCDEDDFKCFYEYQDGELVENYTYVPDELEFELGHIYTLTTEAYGGYDQVDLTLDANTYAIVVDDGYATKGYSSIAYINYYGDDTKKYCFEKMPSGVNVYDDLAADSYSLAAGVNSSTVSSATKIFNVYDHSTEYVKITTNIAKLTGDYFNADGTIDHETSSKVYHIDPRSDTDENGAVCFYFYSGSVITAAIPDENGNVDIYVNKEDYDVYYSSNFKCGVSSGGGRINSYCNEIRPLKTFETTVNTNIEIPESGLTLYNVPAGEYTVEIDSTEYTLENNTIKVTDTKDLQSMNVVLKKAEEPSSSEASSSEASSSEASSSETSSETSSSDDTSSVTESKTSSASSKPSSSSKAANNSNTANPSTGAAAGGLTGIALIAGAAVVVSKKNRK